MQKKIVRRSVPDQDVLSSLSSCSPLLSKIYATRGISSEDELSRELADLLPFHHLSNIKTAAARIADAVMQAENILMIGDFDTDGATSTALAVSALRAFGAKTVDFLVPNRFTFGYGLTPEIVEVAQLRNPDLIITVDNGIASIDGVAKANAYQIDVVITDHHLPGDTLPNATAIVNPNLPGDQFPSKCAAGVGVIFYVMSAVRAELVSRDWFANSGVESPKMTQFLDLVALGTVADVVPLDKNNRALVYQGLRRMRAGLTGEGIKALLQIGKRQISQVVSSDLAFSVAPRLNAAGRLDDMSLGIHCLLTDDPEQAHGMAQQLDQLNQERRVIEEQMRDEAFEIVRELDLHQQLPLGLCLYDPDWHQGVVGLVASRVKEKLHCPVIAFAKVDDNTLKGSARSIKGLHIRDALDQVATQHPELLSRFGGHAMAAGMSINLSDYEAFKQAFSAVVHERLGGQAVVDELFSDGELTADNFTLETAMQLRDAGPWGQGFPAPLFDGVFTIVDQRIVGQNHLKLVLTRDDMDYHLNAIAFQVDTSVWPNHRCQQAEITYRLDINEYRGRRSVQLIVETLRESAVQEASFNENTKSSLSL